MKITFVLRERNTPGTALQNAARYDAEYLASLGHQVRIIEISLHEEPNLAGILKRAGWGEQVERGKSASPTKCAKPLR